MKAVGLTRCCRRAQSFERSWLSALCYIRYGRLVDFELSSAGALDNSACNAEGGLLR